MIEYLQKADRVTENPHMDRVIRYHESPNIKYRVTGYPEIADTVTLYLHIADSVAGCLPK